MTPPLPARQYPPVLGEIQAVLLGPDTALRGLHLDSACAPALL